MSDWLHNLPIVWMVVLIFGVTYLIVLAIFAIVMMLAMLAELVRALEGFYIRGGPQDAAEF
jgi:hypothetical protein